MVHRRLDLSRYVINTPLAGLGQALTERAGLLVTRDVNSLRSKRIEVISALGLSVLLDIGANTGQWSRELRKCGYRGRIISFEPMPSAFAQLHESVGSASNHECLNVGLGSYDGEGELLATKASENSSFRAPMRVAESRYAIEERVSVPVRRLDSALAGITSASDRFYMKIDTQGFEREVLDGSPETLQRTDAVEIELSLVELYEGQALLPEIWQFLVTSGLRPAWVERGFRDSEDIWLLQLDALFVRNESWLRKRV